MINDAVLQILLILAYLAIGLIAVTFPIYAICVTFLPQEKWESEKERKKRIESLKEHISKLAKDLSGKPKDSERFKEIQTRIEQHASEKESLEYLTAKGAVRKPVILLALALVAAIVGIQFLYSGYMELELAMICGMFSGVFSAGAVYRLYKTISSVEYAALRPARTIEFQIRFLSGEKSEVIKLKKKAKLEITVGTREESLEEVEVSVFIPPEIEVKETLTERTRCIMQPDEMRFPNYSLVWREVGFLHMGTYDATAIDVLPKKIGKYEIPVAVCAKGIYEYHASLTLNVVK